MRAALVLGRAAAKATTSWPMSGRLGSRRSSLPRASLRTPLSRHSLVRCCGLSLHGRWICCLARALCLPLTPRSRAIEPSLSHPLSPSLALLPQPSFSSRRFRRPISRNLASGRRSSAPSSRNASAKCVRRFDYRRHRATPAEAHAWPCVARRIAVSAQPLPRAHPWRTLVRRGPLPRRALSSARPPSPLRAHPLLSYLVIAQLRP